MTFELEFELNRIQLFMNKMLRKSYRIVIKIVSTELRFF